MRHSTDEEMQNVARTIRRRLGIDGQVIPDMKTVVTKLKRHGFIRDFVRVPKIEMPNDEAQFDSDTGILYLRDDTYCAADSQFVFSDQERKRARYTIAHEIGHIILQHKGAPHRGQSSQSLKRLHIKTREQERDADRFAAAFLVPAYLVE